MSSQSPPLPAASADAPFCPTTRPWLCLVIVTGYVLLCVLRVPIVVYPGRFWAEDGTWHFYEAYTHTLSSVLFEQRREYYTLLTKITSLVAANAVPLRFSPMAMVLGALLVQTLPVVLILCCRIDALPSWRSRITAVLLVLLVQPNQEVWLNANSHQYFLCLATGIILISEPLGRLSAALRIATLFFAGLTGVVSCLLWPAFVVDYYLTRKRYRLHEIIVLGLVCALQAFYVLQMSTGRQSHFHWHVLPLALLTKQWVLPLTGVKTAEHFATHVQRYDLTHAASYWTLGVLPYALASVGLALWGRRQSRLLLLTGVGVAVISFLVSVESRTAEAIQSHISGLYAGRYYYAPNVMLMLALLMSLRPDVSLSANRRLRPWLFFRAACVLCVAIALIVGSYDYIACPQRGQWFTGPSWPVELKNWQAGKSDQLPIWPVPWTLKLPQEPRDPPMPTYQQRDSL
jgi:hypothetical protein